MSHNQTGGSMSDPKEMWRCQTANCGYVYDPERGDRKGKIPRGTKFEDLPDVWRCPVCGASRKSFACMDAK
jgi:rubredoxin